MVENGLMSVANFCSHSGIVSGGTKADDLRARGHEVHVADVPHGFGVGQMILADDDALVGGSDGRADGHAAGL